MPPSIKSLRTMRKRDWHRLGLGRRRILLWLLLGSAILAISTIIPIALISHSHRDVSHTIHRSRAQFRSSPRHIKDKLGAVASQSSICSKIGIDLLRAGGNAADAMVGTVICIGTVDMYHSGIGGGGFMLLRKGDGIGNETSRYEFVDFRETAPAAASQDMYNGNVNASLIGGLASGVPGELRGLEHLHKNYGRLPWCTVLQPSIKLARNGFPVGQDMVGLMNSAISSASYNFLVNDPAWAEDFAPNGTLVGLNQIMTRKRYANTLEAIAREGADAFYRGPIAEATIKAVQATNGIMTLADLSNYTVAIRDPIQIDYRGWKLTSGSAPSSGVVAMAAMKTIEGYDDIGDPTRINISTHRLDEAIKFAYGERTKLGDPSFVSGLDQYQQAMVSEQTANLVRGKITDYAQALSVYNPDGIETLNTPGTSHIVTADCSGMAISLTTTINLLFGSHLIVPETGVIMNDEMNDFSIPNTSNAFGYIPSEANFVRPGKRPLSSISTTIVEHPDGTFYLATGSAGGSRITTATIQTLWNTLDRNMTTHEALAEPRLHDQLVPEVVSFEYAYDNATVAFMREAGHNVTWFAPGSSQAQMLRRLPNGTFEAAGEPRQVNSGGFAT